MIYHSPCPNPSRVYSSTLCFRPNIGNRCWSPPSVLRSTAISHRSGRDLGCEVFRVGGVADHVHLAVDLARTVTLADPVKKVKQTSSVWIKEQPGGSKSFEWQVGYGAFSIGQSQLAALLEYIETQEEHHRTKTFQEEYLILLAKYGMQGDERYLWD